MESYKFKKTSIKSVKFTIADIKLEKRHINTSFKILKTVSALLYY